LILTSPIIAAAAAQLTPQKSAMDIINPPAAKYLNVSSNFVSGHIAEFL